MNRPNRNLPTAPWYDDEPPSRQRSFTVQMPISLTLQSHQQEPSVACADANPALSIPPFVGSYSTCSSLVPLSSVNTKPLFVNPLLSTVAGIPKTKKRSVQDTLSTEEKILSSIIQSKRPPRALVVPRPSLQELTQFVLHFVQVHNQGNVVELKEILNTRFHERFERVSYRVELPSRKMLKNSKVLTIGVQSYLEYLEHLAKIVPDSVFYVGRPFTLRNHPKQRNLYVMQCNYSYRGTYLIMPHEQDSSENKVDVNQVFPSTLPRDTVSSSSSCRGRDNNKAKGTTASNAVSSSSSFPSSSSSSSSSFSSSSNYHVSSSSSSLASSFSSSIVSSNSSSVVSFPSSSSQSVPDAASVPVGAVYAAPPAALGTARDDLDFSVVFGKDELTSLDFVCFDELNMLDDTWNGLEDLDADTDEPPSLDLETQCLSELEREMTAQGQEGVALTGSLGVQASGAPVENNSSAALNSAGSVISVPFNFSGKLSFYFDKISHKIMRIEYVYFS